MRAPLMQGSRKQRRPGVCVGVPVVCVCVWCSCARACLFVCVCMCLCVCVCVCVFRRKLSRTPTCLSFFSCVCMCVCVCVYVCPSKPKTPRCVRVRRCGLVSVGMETVTSFGSGCLPRMRSCVRAVWERLWVWVCVIVRGWFQHTQVCG